MPNASEIEQFEDWRRPFANLKKKLKSLIFQCPKLYHAVIFSPDLSRHKLDRAICDLEPLKDEEPTDERLRQYIPKVPRTIVSEIEIRIRKPGYHGHFFISEDPRSFEKFSDVIDGFEECMKKSDKQKFIPQIKVPSIIDQRNRDIIYWISMLYHYAATRSTHQFSACHMYQYDSHNEKYCTWDECPVLSESPKDWMSYIGNFNSNTRKVLRGFKIKGIEYPDAIIVYLEDDLISSSLSALDTILYRLREEVARRKRESVADKKQKSEKTRAAGKKSLSDAIWLTEILRAIHRIKSSVSIDLPIPRKTPPYYKQDEIATYAKWFRDDGSLDIVRLSRRMDVLFPDKGMMQYRSLAKEAKVKLKLHLEKRLAEIDSAFAMERSQSKRKSASN